MSDKPYAAPDSTEPTSSNVPFWFWLLGGLAVAWNLMGLLAFVAQMSITDEMMAALPEAQQEIYRNIPTWVIACFAAAVFGGVIGCILLLVRTKLAIPVLIISMVGVLGQYGHMFFMTDTLNVMGASAMILPVVVVLISIALVPYAISCKQKGLLK